mgnify:CR=1 FL=1
MESRFERDDDAHGCSSVLRIQNRLTTVNKPAEADLLRHSTRGKGHIGQVPSDDRLWFTVFWWIADLLGARVGKWRVQVRRPKAVPTN